MHGEERTNMIWSVPLVAQYVQVDDPTLLTTSAEGICAAQKEDQCIGNGPWPAVWHKTQRSAAEVSDQGDKMTDTCMGQTKTGQWWSFEMQNSSQNSAGPACEV